MSFLPPIQGGKFRLMAEEDVSIEVTEDTQDNDDDVQSQSSAGNSSVSTPIFELPEHSTLRYRNNYDSRSDRSASVTSASSVELDEALPRMSLLDARTKEELDLDLAKYPSLDPVTQDAIVSKYRLLNKRIRAEGLYQCSYSSYGIELMRYTFLFGTCLALIHYGWYATAGIFMGAFWHQLVFTAHDAGHMGITHNYTIDTVLGIVVADFLGGLSLGWWKDSHNVHHIITNHPEHDPDIELMPFFAISHRFFDSLYSTYHKRVLHYDAFAKVAVRFQHLLYYPILALGRFNLYLLSWDHLIQGRGPRKGAAAWHRWLEVAGQVFFWSWFGYGLLWRSIPTWTARVVFVLISHMVTCPLHVQITLSHFAMSTADLGVAESFPQRMLRTTMDVDCPQWLDWVHGGLQFQAIHHLYPRIPRHNLRRTQKLVQEFCEEVDIPYALYGFVEGNGKVIGHLADVGRQAAIFAKCQAAMVENPELAH